MNPSPLAEVHAGLADPRNDRLLDSKWEQGVEWAATRFGYRDQIPRVQKRHFHRTSHPLGLTRMVRKHRTRKALRLVMPSLDGEEWRMPWWLGSKRRLEDAVVVLKTLGVAGWVDWIARRRKDLMIIHIVRHPGGFLRSWDRRYLQLKGENAVRESNRKRLKRLVEVDDSWTRKLGDIDSMGPHESELWFWRYSTEAVHRAGFRHHRYRMVLYEDLASNAVDVMKAVYSDCGLRWTPSVERCVTSHAEGSEKLAHAWRESLGSEHKAKVRKVLRGSLMEEWWQGRDRVEWRRFRERNAS